MGAKLRGALTVESLNGSLSAGQQNITGNISTEEGLEGELSPGIYEYYTRKESRELFATKDVVSTYVTHYEFPNRGREAAIYIATEENKVYRWNPDTASYFCIGSDYSDIKMIDGGDANG